MAFEEGTEKFVCTACNAKLLAQWSRMPVREDTTLKCIACGWVLFKGKTLRDYWSMSLS